VKITLSNLATPKLGQVWNHGREYYLLVHAGNGKCFLASLSDGNRYSGPVTVGDASHITDNEFKQICSSDIFECLGTLLFGAET
jgi:hypothetical protein